MANIPDRNETAQVVFLPQAYAAREIVELLTRSVGTMSLGTQIQLAGFRAVTGASGLDPAFLPDSNGKVLGTLFELGDRSFTRLSRIQKAVGNRAETVEVRCEESTASAQVFLSDPRLSAAESNNEQSDPALFAALIAEIADALDAGQAPDQVLAGARRRALASHTARGADRPATLGQKTSVRDIEVASRTRNHAGFFATDTFRYRHRLFREGWSPHLDREVFLSGDAVSVLPWDPHLRKFLLIRQIRAGMVARGDRDPWSLEAIAGLVDRNETLTDAIRREAREEADLEVHDITQLTRYYTSPGTTTEFITSYVARCDLSEYRSGVHGLASEHEDIETLVVSEDAAAEALDKGEIVNAPLMISLLAFYRRRADLAVTWGLTLEGADAAS